MLLFPPPDVAHLSFPPGASSSSLDVFECLESSVMEHTHPHDANLLPGDVLFLPPLWLHAASPVTSSSVAVNVFFRNLEAGYAAGRDIYGNRDLAAYDKGRQEIAHIDRAFTNVTAEAKSFYIRRLAAELMSKATV